MDLTEKQKKTLALTILGEAGGEGPAGQRAVAWVIRNRAESGRYPSDPVAVALQHNPAGYYQFATWASADKGGNQPARRYTEGSRTYNNALRIIDEVFSGATTDPTGGAFNYYANTGPNAIVAPSWFSRAATAGTVQIGNHLFAARKTPATSIRAGVATTGSATGYVPLPSPSPLVPQAETPIASLGGDAARAVGATGGKDMPTVAAARSVAVPAVSVAETRAEQATARAPVAASPAIRAGQKLAGDAAAGSGTIKVGRTVVVSPDGTEREVDRAGTSDQPIPAGYRPAVDLPDLGPATRTVTYQTLNPAWDVWNRTYGQSALTDSTAPKGGGMSALAGVGAAAGVAKLGSMSQFAGVGGGVVPKAPPRTIAVTRTVQVTDPAARLAAARQAQLEAAQRQALAQQRAQQQARSAANAAAPGTTFLQDRGVNTSNMSAGQQANALRDALGGQHRGSFN